jgi:hypothetical protein
MDTYVHGPLMQFGFCDLFFEKNVMLLIREKIGG